MNLTEQNNLLHLSENQEKWVGYIIRRERQRRSMTQSFLAGELGFGMSAISTIEAGNAYANIVRTMHLLRKLEIAPGLSIEAIMAQQSIHAMLNRAPQTRVKPTALIRPASFQPRFSYLPVVADKAVDMPDQAL